jgi:hypothetical protein
MCQRLQASTKTDTRLKGLHFSGSNALGTLPKDSTAVEANFLGLEAIGF